jgi:hypothetical protein
MNTKYRAIVLISLYSLMLISCDQGYKSDILHEIGTSEYNRLMSLSLDDFDQSSSRFRPYTGNYEFTQNYKYFNSLTITAKT